MLLLTLACAPKLVYVRGSEDEVVATLNRSWGSDTFELMSSDRGKLDTAQTSGRQLYFDLPQDSVVADDRLYIRHKSSKLNLSRRRWGADPYAFSNPYWANWLDCRDALRGAATDANPRALKSACGDARGLSEALAQGVAVADSELRRRAAARERADADTALRSSQAALAKAIDRHTGNDDWLDGSPAYVDGYCVTPPTGELPARPPRACSPAEQEGFALGVCSVVELGLGGVGGQVGDVDLEWEGCSEAGILGSPACTAVANYFVGRNATLEETLLDFGISAAWAWVEEVAAESAQAAWEEGGFWNTVYALAIGIGLLAKQAYEFSDCIDDVESICRREYDDWQDQRDRVVSAPGKMRKECDRRRAEQPVLKATIVTTEREVVRDSARLREAVADLASEASVLAANKSSLSAALASARPGYTTSLRRADVAPRMSGTTLHDWRKRAVFGDRSAKQAWNGWGVGLGMGVADQPPAVSQGMWELVGPGPEVELQAHLTLLPVRLGLGLRPAGVDLLYPGISAFDVEEGVADVDQMSLSYVQVELWMDAVLWRHRQDFLLVTAGGALGERDYDMTVRTEFGRASSGETLSIAALRYGAVLSPPDRIFQLHAGGEFVYAAPYGWGRSVGLRLDIAGLRLSEL